MVTSLTYGPGLLAMITDVQAASSGDPELLL